MQNAAIINANDGQATVSGELNFATVPALRQSGINLLNSHSHLSFDFQQVTRCDSSALSLLIAWTRAAKRQNKPITFLHLPEQLLEMAKLSRLNNILPIRE